VRRGRGRRSALLLLLAVLWSVTGSLPSTSAVFTATTATTAQFTAWVAAVPAVLTQPPATASCISHTGSGPCTDGEALSHATAVAVSADGASVYVASDYSHAVSALSRSSATGFISQLGGASACVQSSNSSVSGGPCAKVGQMFGTNDVAVTADGRFVYVTALDENAVTVLSRGAGGELVRVAGSAGCVQNVGGSCTNGKAMMNASGVTVSPDDKHVYVMSKQQGTVSIMSRNTTSGALTPVVCLRGSATDAEGEACTVTSALPGASSMAFSPTGGHAYVASRDGSAVAAFTRDAGTGVLTPLTGTAKCVSETGDGGTCVDGTGLSGASDIAVSSDGASVYVASAWSNAVAVFARHNASGALTQLPGTSACVSNDGSSGCVDGNALAGPTGVAVSPDRTHVFVTSSGSGSLSVFHRTAGTGALTQASGTAGCISATAAGCTVGRALAGASGVVVSPLGEDVYVTSLSSSAVALFTRTR
jgi:DNA-binding beta-propeller fold protein YncE